MKTLLQAAHRPKKPKINVQLSEAKYWGCMGRDGPFKRSDGSVSIDKTRGWHSRPGNKQQRRNANRSIMKRGRQVLKANMLAEAEEAKR